MTGQEEENKLKVLDAAIRIYTSDRTRFTSDILIEDANINRDEYETYFESKYAVIRYYYEWVLSQYELMIAEVPDFNNFTTAEKISNFLYALFDILDEQDLFVEQTYRRFIYHALMKTAFQSHMERLYRSFIESDENIPSFNKNAAGMPLYLTLARTSMWIVSYRLDDDSPQKEKTMALVDKITALFEEIITNTIPDKTIDLLTFLGSNSKILSHFPFTDTFKHLFAKILPHE
jgi:AcrR family transcriptional regulator